MNIHKTVAFLANKLYSFYKMKHQKGAQTMEKISMNDIRKKNYSDIYRLIYQERRISKSKIASSLEMSLPTVTQHLSALETEGLIEKQGQMASGIGRKAAAYSIRPEARVSVGVEVLPDQITAVVLNLYGEVIGKKEVSLSFSKKDEYFETLYDTVCELLQESKISNDAVLGTGISMQGLVSEDGQRMLYGKILDCTGLTIRPLSERFPYPVRLIHDAECAAEIELWRNPELTDVIYLSLGVHLDGAIIMHGKIQRGRTGRTGTVEHMTLVEGGRPCYCGKLGCMECYCSVNALLEEGENLTDFFLELRQGASRQVRRWMDYLNYLATALNNLHMVLDCTIVLGGHIAPYLIKQDIDVLFSELQDCTAFPEEENFICIGTQENNAVAAGAAIPFIRTFLEAI